MSIQSRRSLLFVPASHQKAIQKSRTLAADTLVFDLEDAVEGTQKAQALQLLITELRQGGFEKRELLVRVNSIKTPFWQKELRVLSEVKIDGIVMPKVEQPFELLAVMQQTSLPVWMMAETPLAMLNLRAIAEAGVFSKQGKLQGIIVGTNDLAENLQAELSVERSEVFVHLTHAVLVARAYGLEVIDGVYNAFHDKEGLTAQCLQAVRLGFTGKSLIHPEQIEVTNTLFSPTQQQLEDAQKIIEVFEQAKQQGQGVTSYKGKMIEQLHVTQALKLLARGRKT